MGLITRFSLLLMLVAGVVLATTGLFTWFRFNEAMIQIKGLHVDTVTSEGDGYALMALGCFCATLAGWLNLRASLNRVAIFAICVAASLALLIALTNLLAPGNVCDSGLLNSGSNHLACATGSGDVFFTAGEGSTSGILWVATGLSLFIGLMALALPVIENKFYEDAPADAMLSINRRTTNLEHVTDNALRLIAWFSVGIAMVAFVPWIDKHSVRVLTGDYPVAMTALGDAVLFASAALACAVFASQMRRDPSEVVWAGLIVTSGVMFVFAGSEVVESTQGCYNNGTILGLLNGHLLGTCSGPTEYELSPGTAIPWTALMTSAIVALLGLTLPIIETIGRRREPLERAGQW